MGIYDWLGFAGVAAGMFAAILWFLASRIKVPHDSHAMVPALRRMGQMNAKAALCACIAAICTYLAWLGTHEKLFVPPKPERPAVNGTTGP
jgi:hypothetical protein